jgi:competence protein ComEC
MPITRDDCLYIYVLNVGQGDTSVIITPQRRVILIDAYRPRKLIRLLRDLGMLDNDPIDHLIITHPHKDHYSGANSLMKTFRITEATLAPFWHDFGLGPPTYRQLMVRLRTQKAKCNFLSGYSRWYPDEITRLSPAGAAEIDQSAPFLELLGPTNGLIGMLERADAFDTNHLSIMTRLTWDPFRMIFAADAQMENWGPFDSEGLLEEGCVALKAAHHGSANGTQWERINRLKPQWIIISSDANKTHRLPDLIGAAVFSKYANQRGNMSEITGNSGTIRIKVEPSGIIHVDSYYDKAEDIIDLSNATSLHPAVNCTDWRSLLQDRIANLP